MFETKPESITALIEGITPEIYQKLRTAVELGKWETGQPLTDEQKENCLQAVIAYEHRHVPIEQRTGFMNPEALAGSACSAQPETIASDRQQTPHAPEADEN